MSLQDQPYYQTLNNNGLVQRKVLLHNELQECIPQLGNITSIGFRAVPRAGSVGFCLDEIELLPPQPIGKLALQQQ